MLSINTRNMEVDHGANHTRNHAHQIILGHQRCIPTSLVQSPPEAIKNKPMLCSFGSEQIWLDGERYRS